MLKYGKMMTSQMIAGLAVSVRCSCPTLVLHRWDAEMLSLDVDVVIVVDESTNHAKCGAATFSLDDVLLNFDVVLSLVDNLDDAMICLADVAVPFLYDVVVVLVLL